VEKPRTALITALAGLLLLVGIAFAVTDDRSWIGPLAISAGLAAVVLIYSRAKGTRPRAVSGVMSVRGHDPRPKRLEERTALLKQLPTKGRMEPGMISQIGGDHKDWWHSLDRTEDLGYYVQRVEDSSGTLTSLELRSVFQPGVVIAALAGATFLRREGSRDHSLFFEGDAKEGQRVVWRLDFLL
jgi:hypothetical protein